MPCDSAFKDLLERDPGGWVHRELGAAEREVRLGDSGISTVSGAAGKVLLPAP